MIDIKNLPTLSLSFGGQNSSILILPQWKRLLIVFIYQKVACYIAIYFELEFQLYFIFGSLQQEHST